MQIATKLSCAQGAPRPMKIEFTRQPDGVQKLVPMPVSRNPFLCQRRVHGEPGSFWTRAKPEPYTNGVLIAGTHISVTIEEGWGKHGRGDRYGKSDRVLLHVFR